MANDIWDTVTDFWDQTILLWSGIVEPAERIRGGSRGGLRKQWDIWKKLPEDEKKKIIRVIVILKGIKYGQQKEIKEYEITVKDIKLLMEEYEKVRDKFKIQIDEIKDSHNKLKVEIDEIEIT